ncbi:FHA domain-containing protein [Lentzea tibetensis]|uniref:FHA domain-containing protein n=1 Tax=Lentzea tibetensis TaxID=2591470 RepID=A0A563F264_9PSEU|nr:FtsK/SpoIIIE domain-containing protein [Lentzea tibetensis]TWP54055.1 FHA domain-containing protein [Lentzea tibetensis]
MKIKFTLRRSGRPPVDLVATVDSATTVGDVAVYLVRAGTIPQVDGTPTLAVIGADQRALDPHEPVGESGLRSGATVTVAVAGAGFADPRAGSAAVVEVVAGPDLGRQYPVHRGSNVIGREPGCDVRLSDPLISRQHARLNITDIAEIIDLGSANGVQLGESSVSRSVLRPGDRARLGDTELTVRVLHAAPAATDGTAVAFVRPPRLNLIYPGTELIAPEPPVRPARQRFPVIPLIAPVLMGAVLYLITRSLASLAFVALSPLMIIGYAVESALAGRSAYRRAVAQFRADLADLVDAAEKLRAEEVVARADEHPPLTSCVEAVHQGGPLLWTRRPADPGFAEIRLGTGTMPARNKIVLPDPRRLPRDLYAELVSKTESFDSVDAVPVVASPAEHGGVGLAGSRNTLLPAARAVIAHTVALHSPSELVLTGFASSQSAPDWDWLKWLPHTTSPHSPLGARHLAADGAAATTLISELEALVEQRSAGESAVIPAVVVLVEEDAPVERSRLVSLAETGWRYGIHVVWLAVDVALLPAACRTFVTVEHRTASAGFVHTGARVTPLVLDQLSQDEAVNLARALAPLVDTGARIDDDSDLPRAVSLLNVVEPALEAAAEAVIERWRENRSIVAGPCAPATPVRQAGTLRAVVGKSAAGAHALDLRTDGPHALVGGTTGSGKSELLQSWILAMAVAHSPQRVTFLLVDYKGGSAFKEFAELPHAVGFVTDLNPHLVHRALVSLSAELRHREQLFARYRVKDLEELEKLDAAVAPPSLVIVVDEFAALVKELPEFVDGVVNVAQRGRSLGVHLILATQRPAGVIKDNLRANTNLRLALRTADEADSVDVLGSPQAAFFDPALPGRAVSKTGPGRLVSFQAGYAGGWTPEVTPPPEILVEQLCFGTGASWEVPADEDSPADPGPTDIARLVRAVRTACSHARITPPRRPWLPSLRTCYDLGRLPSASDQELVFGVRDDPEHQAQPPAVFRPDVDGNLVVYGTGGTGKTTLLRTLAVAAGDTARGGPCHVYGLDFGGRGLAMLEKLPHVGSVIAGTDHERVGRLLSWLRQLVDERATRYASCHAGTITEYRASGGSDPRILLLLDGVAAFRSAYEVGDRSKWFDVLVAIASDGRQVGVHLVMSADRPAAVPSVLGAAVQTRVALRLADENDYVHIGLPTDVLGPASAPGRGLLHGAEIQVAMLGSAPDVGAQAARLGQLAERLAARGLDAAPPIRSLPDRVGLVDLPVSDGAFPVLGISSETLASQPFDPTGTFLICGPPRSGRTTALHAVAVAVRRWDPSAQLHYFGNRRSRLASLDLWANRALNDADAAELARALVEKLTVVPPEQTVVVVVENVTSFAGGPADAALHQLIQRCVHDERFVVVDGEATALQSNAGLAGAVKASRAGLALAPDVNDGAAFRTTFPSRLRRTDFPLGRALHVTAGTTTVVQTGLPE